MSLEQSFGAARVADANGETTQSIIPKAGYVLVVEDDAATRQMVTACFGQNNVPARGISHRQDVQRCFNGTEPRVIILDGHLGRDAGLMCSGTSGRTPMSRSSS